MAKIKNVNPVGNSDIDGVLSGYAWADKAIQYAFPIKPSDYGYSGEKGNNFSGFNPQLRNAALYILEEDYGGAANNGFSVEGLTHLRLNEGGNKTAEIRFGFSATANPTAYAYYPSNNESGGDVWMGTAEKSYRFLSPAMMPGWGSCTRSGIRLASSMGTRLKMALVQFQMIMTRSNTRS